MRSDYHEAIFERINSNLSQVNQNCLDQYGVPSSDEIMSNRIFYLDKITKMYFFPIFLGWARFCGLGPDANYVYVLSHLLLLTHFLQIYFKYI